MNKLYLIGLVAFLSGNLYANCGNGNGNGNGCSGSVGPQGPQGLPGNNGTNGTNGINGTNGLNGKDASTRVMPVIDAAVRVYDGKYIQLQAFNVVVLADKDTHAGAGSKEFMAGARIVLKLGKSYEERLIEKQARELEATKRLVQRLLNN